MEKIITWGTVVGTHGVRGEMKVLPELDFLKLAKKIEVFTVGGKPYKKIAVRGHKDMILLTLEGVDDMDKAQLLRGKVITTAREDIDLGRGHYFYSDLYGFEVYDTRLCKIIGVLDHIDTFPAGDVYCIKGENEKNMIMIPMVPAFDGGADLEKKWITVTTIEGMVEDAD